MDTLKKFLTIRLGEASDRGGPARFVESDESDRLIEDSRSETTAGGDSAVHIGGDDGRSTVGTVTVAAPPLLDVIDLSLGGMI